MGASVNILDFWRPEDNSEDDDRFGLKNIGPAWQRAIASLPNGGTLRLPAGEVRDDKLSEIPSEPGETNG